MSHYTPEQISEMFPNIAKHRPEIAAQLASHNGADSDHNITHPRTEVWLPGNKLDYFRSTGGVAVNDHKHTTPYVGGWESLSNGRWQSGGIGAQSSYPHRVN